MPLRASYATPLRHGALRFFSLIYHVTPPTFAATLFRDAARCCRYDADVYSLDALFYAFERAPYAIAIFRWRYGLYAVDAAYFRYVDACRHAAMPRWRVVADVDAAY